MRGGTIVFRHDPLNRPALSPRRGPRAGRPRVRLLAVAILPAALALVLCACAHGGPLLNRPNGVAVAADGTLLIVDKNHYRVVRLDRSGKVLGEFGGLGHSPGSLPAPYDIAIGKTGEIYVCDREYADGGAYKDHDGVKVFDAAGRLIREIGAQDYQEGDANNGPYGLDVDSAGNVFIADYHKGRVREFDASGLLVQVIGRPGSGPGELNGPNDVAVDEDRGVIYVLEAVNARVQSFALDGRPLGSFGRFGRGDGELSYPQYLDLDAEGNLYVSDMGNRRIKKFSPSGEFLQAFVPPPSSGDDWQLMGLTVRDAGGAGSAIEILAVDTRNNRILVFDGQSRLEATLG